MAAFPIGGARFVAGRAVAASLGDARVESNVDGPRASH